MSKIRSFFAWVSFPFDWLRLARESRQYRKAPSVILAIANPSSVGGTELQVQIIAEALKTRLGGCLVLVSGKLEEGRSNLFIARLQASGIPFVKLGSVGLVRYERWPFLKKKIVDLLRNHVGRAKVCHFFNPSATALVPVVKSMGIAIYYMETGMPALNEWGKILHRTAAGFDYVTSVSSAGLTLLKSLYKYQGPSCVIPSMVEIPAGHFVCRKPIKGVFDVVYFGRMAGGKGVDLLIRSFSRVVREIPYATLSLIGFGGRLPELKKQVKELGLSPQVTFLDWLQNEALFSRLVNMDLFCLPSYTEGLPSSILEAMAIGLPVLATDVGGVSEIIGHRVSGVLIPPGNETALTEALLELAKDPQWRVQLSEEGLSRWKKVGSKEVVLDRLMRAYAVVTEETQSPARADAGLPPEEKFSVSKRVFERS